MPRIGDVDFETGCWTTPRPRSWRSRDSRAHWVKVWSTTPLERRTKDVKRRARVVGIVPNEASVIRLVGAILAAAHDAWQAGDRRSRSAGSLAKLSPERDTGAVSERTTGD